MHNQPSIDRSIFIPVGIGVFSAFGLCLVLLIIYRDKPQAVVAVDQTVTPFKYLLLATETPIVGSEEISPKELIPPTFVIPREEEFLIIPATPSQINTLVNSGSPVSTVTPTVEETGLVVVDRYDDPDPLINYAGNWISQTDVGSAYQGTLHVSNAVDNDAVFSFVGRQIIIGYQGAVGLGTVTIHIDDTEFLLGQSTGNEWVSPQLTEGEHFVIIIHKSGASVNLDYINILDSG